MAWDFLAAKPVPRSIFARPVFEIANVDLEKIVTIDFETYWNKGYTLRKLSTSEYIRHSSFKAHMASVKIGTGAVHIYSGEELVPILNSIDWDTHDILCHNTAFDGFILARHYGVVPRQYFDTLCMARGLHSNDIRANLDSVAQFYNVGNKIPDVLEQTLGVRELPAKLYEQVATYCMEDTRLTFEIFKLMLIDFPATELKLIDLSIRMFCDPQLCIDISRVEKELKRETKEKELNLLAVVGNQAAQKHLIKLLGKEKAIEHARSMVAKNELFADMLQIYGITPPTKPSPSNSEKEIYAFSKTDTDFTELLAHPNISVRNLVECRLSVKSTTNETRAGRFLDAGKDDMKLPVLLLYYGAHTGRFSGGNKMNMQNLKRGGELRRSIIAPANHHIVVADSGQIEVRVNAWVSGQLNLLNDFRQYDDGLDRDAYCKFADIVYGRVITKADELERFVGKVCVLGLGYQMGGPKLQNTLATGAMGPPVFLELDTCYQLVNTYRRINTKIVNFWKLCEAIIEDMHVGRTGSYKCIAWEKECIWLPNGMRLKYPSLRRTEVQNKHGTSYNEYSYLRKGAQTKIYGGLLCENIVQALARIIVTDQMLDISARWRVVTMSHDEIVTIAPIEDAQACFIDMKKTMSTSPVWCADLPLTAAGGHAVNYSK